MTDVDFTTCSVLLIEDETFMSELIGEFLNDLKFSNIVTASNGQEALVKLRLGEILPNIILCDLEMPVMNGFEFLENLRGDQGLEFKETPVLVLTGHKDEESIKRAIKLGIHGYLVKPVTKEDLVKRITFALTSPMIDPSSVS